MNFENSADESTGWDFGPQRVLVAESFGSKRRHRRQVQQLVELLPENGTFIDVGGYLGNITGHVTQARRCRVFLFEPVRGHYEFCRQRFRDHEYVTVENLALSNAAGESLIYRGHRNLAWNTMLPEVTNRRNRRLPPETVQCVVFDDYARTYDINAVDLVKIDVEGFEYRVLAGMRQSIAHFLPHLEIEVHFGCEHPYWREQADEFEYLFSLGYERFDLEETLDPQRHRKLANVVLRSPVSGTP